MWIWSTNVQIRCTWKSWLANLKNFYAIDDFYASFHQFYHSHHLWLHRCCWPGHSQNSCHKQLELLTLSLKSACLQIKFFEVSHSFDSWFRARRRQKLAGGHFTKTDDQKIELDFVAYNVVIKLIVTWYHEIF